MGNDELLLRFRDNAQLAPFLVLTAGRSRTMWLSAFLTYGICVCNFESIVKISSFSDVMGALSIPGIGSAETMAAPAWRLLKVAAPNLRAVVVKRPTREIIESLVTAASDRMQLDEVALHVIIERLQRALDVVSEDAASVLTVDFAELKSEEVCKRIFEHCLPYKHDSGWWKFMDAKVLDPDIVQMAQMMQARQHQVAALGREARHLTFRLARQGHIRKAPRLERAA